MDEKLQPIAGTEKVFDVDTVLLSVGLIPENSLLEDAGAVLHPRTKGPIVDERCMTSIEGIFACGNSLHVHDLVDFVYAEGQRAGKAAADYLHQIQPADKMIDVIAKGELSYILPQKLHPSDTKLFYRVKSPLKNCTIEISCNNQINRTLKKPALIPSIMEEITIKKQWLDECDGPLVVEVKA